MATRKNAIWIFGDQHPGHALSCHGNPNLNTPHLDRLAVEGLDFVNAVSGYPLCCPYRAALLTSRYPHDTVPGHQYPLDPSIPTIAAPFKAAGYDTAYFGKWHLDGIKENSYGNACRTEIPKERRGGFDTWIGYDNNNAQWDVMVHGHDHDKGEVPMHKLKGYETDELTNLLLDYINRKAAGQENFFAALSVQPPHDPYQAPAEYMARHNPAQVQMRPNVPNIPRLETAARRDIAGAYAMIENLDDNIGRIIARLEELDLWEDTVLIYFSDHGDMHGSHGQMKKTCPYQEATNVPFIIGSGGGRYRNRIGRPNAVINHVDIAPTTLGLCGLDVPEYMVGHDYSYLRRRDLDSKDYETPDSAYMQLVVPTKHGYSTDRAWRGITTRDGWKYICFEGAPWLMFNLNDDPYEQANLAHNSIFAGKRKELHERLARWIEETGDTFSLPVPDEPTPAAWPMPD